MKIETLQKEIFKVDFEDLYIKPFYKGDVLVRYSICINTRNNEIQLCCYTSKKYAEHMLHLISRYKGYPDVISVLNENIVQESLYLDTIKEFLGLPY